MNEALITPFLEPYLAFIQSPSYDEIYKWQVAKTVQNNWDIEAVDLAGMIDRSFAHKSTNLWSGQNYLPKAMLMQWAAAEPEVTREALRELLLGTDSLDRRMGNFRALAQGYVARTQPGMNSYQDMRAMSLWLGMVLPDEHYLYKSTMLNKFCERTGLKAIAKRENKYDRILPYYALCGEVREALLTRQDIVSAHRALRGPGCHADAEHHLMTQDVIYYAAEIMKEEEWKNLALRTAGDLYGTQMKIRSEGMSIPLNSILYGPPGTGKTHHTINAAVQVCDPEYYAKHAADRAKIRERYEALRVQDWRNVQGPGQIGFCTFHQSFSYEDFVEGIKPMPPVEGDAYLKYEVRPGVLKQMVDRAQFHASGEAAKVKKLISLTDAQMDKAEFYKLSLGDSNNPNDQRIYDYCIENGVIAIGFLGQHDLTGLSEQAIRALPLAQGQSSYDHTAMAYFTHYLREGNYVVVTMGNFVVRAIGKITGDYYFDPKSEIGYPHFRKVEWLVKNEAIPSVEIYGKPITQQTIYKLKKEYVQRDFFAPAPAALNGADPAKRFVLIIDEINRGNVAGVFGELITLIEENKRAGRSEALEVTLPYSQETFSIPDNLYIIGTMNTADRSVEALDSALRRRFSFKAMMPETKNLQRLQNSKVDIRALLQKMNERLVQLLDEDHQIGHSHFWELHKEAEPLPALREVFADKIIPQLEEYFHRDRSKLRLVLGEAFVEEVPADEKLFLNSEDMDFEPRATYRITPQAKWSEQAFMAIHGNA